MTNPTQDHIDDQTVPAGGSPGTAGGLDPQDWAAFRATCHQAVDQLVDWWASARTRPVWRPIPERVKSALAMPLPTDGVGLDKACELFGRLILPYPAGNTHPRFMGWVNGAGTPAGALADLLAGALDANLGGREHAPIYVERQVIEWSRQIFGFPAGTSGLLVSGTSMATLIGLAVARQVHVQEDVRRKGLQSARVQLVGYVSRETHSSVPKAFELLGLGRESLRMVPVDAAFRLDVRVLECMIAADRTAGLRPFCLVGTAGTINTGAIDDLAALARIGREQDLWLHADGAFGALAVLAPDMAPQLAGIEQAHSLAFDFHKWLHVPYDAGCVLVRDERAHRAAFSLRHDYLAATDRGLADGNPWYCEYGPEQSRGFRALKVWFTLLTYGLDRLGAAIARENCAQARHLARRVADAPELELLAPVSLNIVCFRFRDQRLTPRELDHLNAAIVADLQEEGIAAPSTTRIDGLLAIRACLCNHRVEQSDLDALVDGVLARGHARMASSAGGI